MTPPRVPTVLLEVPDFDLGLRGKLERADKAGPGARLAFCSIIYGLSVVDEVVDTPLGSAANGYPDVFAVPDEATRVSLPWRQGTEAVIADTVHADGSPVLESPRTLLRHLLAEFDPLGLQPRFGFEYEVYVTQAPNGPQPGAPLDRTISGYSLSRLAEAEPVIEEFLARTEGIGTHVEMVHSEIGPGFFEFALAPADPLTAADRAARSRQCFREVCAAQGLRATFMAKLYGAQSGSGGHVHQSLWQDTRNVFSDGAGQLSEPGQAYVAGLLATMSDFSALFNPFVNSYKRLDPALFVAARATWGHATRNAACRVILDGAAPSARVEHRRPGADASPYLVAAGMLAGGLYGLRGGAHLVAPLGPGDDLALAGAELPADLRTAVGLLEGSTVARDLLGPEFVACYGATRRGELAAFDRWWQSSVTEWELARYPDNL